MPRKKPYTEGHGVCPVDSERQVRHLFEEIMDVPLHPYHLDTLMDLWREADNLKFRIRQEIIHIMNVNRLDGRSYRLGAFDSKASAFREIIKEIGYDPEDPHKDRGQGDGTGEDEQQLPRAPRRHNRKGISFTQGNPTNLPGDWTGKEQF